MFLIPFHPAFVVLKRESLTFYFGFKRRAATYQELTTFFCMSTCTPTFIAIIETGIKNIKKKLF